ncbi:hypothetical protein C8R44DRAFT_857727 [Mycena epipterygia]|nr:hypothetical protein C8R44DRAFT_857727 [Mycena epipterygia]
MAGLPLAYGRAPTMLSIDEKDSADTWASGFTEISPSSATLLLPNRRNRDFEGIHIRTTSTLLPMLCVILHLWLIFLHVLAFAVAVRHLEHAVVFPLDRESIISPAISGITTAFATIYTSILVLISQTLAMRRNLRMEQTLTAAHDKFAAWSGIGSALLRLWNQRIVPSSVLGTLSVFLYLTNILVVHITTPSLLSLQTFNASQSTNVTTHGLPEYSRGTPTMKYVPLLICALLSAYSLHYYIALGSWPPKGFGPVFDFPWGIFPGFPQKVIDRDPGHPQKPIVDGE